LPFQDALPAPATLLLNKTAGEVLPPGEALTGPASPRRSVRAPAATAFYL
jgi:hypothetical protein